MDIVWGCSRNQSVCDAMIDWTSEHIWPGKPAKRLPEGVALGVFDKGEIVGCVVYHDWEPDAGVIELSAAATSKRWLTRPVLKAMFEFPFNEIGVQMVVTRVSAREGQAHLHRIFRAYGFTQQTVKRLFGRHEDGVIFSLTDDAWKASKFQRK